MNRREFLNTAVAATARPALVSAQAGTGLRAGFAERDITPEIGMEQPGGYGKVFHKSFHDACKVRAGVFDDGKTRVALVGVDALVVPRLLVKEVRAEVQRKCGIQPDAVLIGASHSHSSGPVGMVLPGEYDHASPLVQELAYKKSSMADPRYLEKFHREIVNAVVLADLNRAPVVAGFGSGREDKVAYNRRFRMKNGLTFTHPGKGNPDIVSVAGPTDPEVGVVGIWSKDDRLLGCVVNFVCHATTSPGGISANWIYYLEKTIRGLYGPDVVVVFLQGPSGDVTQVDNLDPAENPHAEQWARLVGGRVGAEAVKVLLSMATADSANLAARTKVWRIDRRAPSPERLQKCLAMVKQDPKQVGVTEWTFAKEIVMLDALIQKEKSAEVEVQAIQIGPTVFLSNPAEYFCQYGLEIKQRSKFPFTCPVELANGCVGYVPTEEALGPGGGGYETRMSSYTNLVPNAGSQIRDACVELAAQLTPGEVPKPRKARPAKESWGYGSVPPELS